jgi:3'-phosphoadenosine 5'-phosphosulfate sulfotransferase (PAPS reductase)/FAD synthetase
MKEIMQLSFSGGRTSGYMTKMMLDNYSDQYDFIVTFANTGLEHEKTLEFVNNCDKHFHFNTVWLEADVKHGEKKATEHRIVTFDTASRGGEPYEEVVKKYGIPNAHYRHCTRELKLHPMRSYLKSIGIQHRDIKTAVGIRIDETRRVSKQAEMYNIVYPLIDLLPTDKQDVLDWWSEQEFDLDMEEYNSNCKLCFHKRFGKLFNQLDEEPQIIEFHKRMESTYSQAGKKNPNSPDRVFFKYGVSASRLWDMYVEDRATGATKVITTDYEDGGCSESCEVYLTE